MMSFFSRPNENQPRRELRNEEKICLEFLEDSSFFFIFELMTDLEHYGFSQNEQILHSQYVRFFRET